MAIVIIHSRTKELITGTYSFEWSRHDYQRLSTGKLVSRHMLVSKKKALSLIEKHGLVESFTCKDGTVYDTPDGDLKKIFPAYSRTKEDIAEIEKVDKI